MDYRTYLKYLMTRGQAVKLNGQGISYVGLNPLTERMDAERMAAAKGQNYVGTGTISRRAIVDRAIDSMNNLNISGSGARKKRLFST